MLQRTWYTYLWYFCIFMFFILNMNSVLLFNIKLHSTHILLRGYTGRYHNPIWLIYGTKYIIQKATRFEVVFTIKSQADLHNIPLFCLSKYIKKNNKYCLFYYSQHSILLLPNCILLYIIHCLFVRFGSDLYVTGLKDDLSQNYCQNW